NSLLCLSVHLLPAADDTIASSVGVAVALLFGCSAQWPLEHCLLLPPPPVAGWPDRLASLFLPPADQAHQNYSISAQAQPEEEQKAIHDGGGAAGAQVEAALNRKNVEVHPEEETVEDAWVPDHETGQPSSPRRAGAPPDPARGPRSARTPRTPRRRRRRRWPRSGHPPWRRTAPRPRPRTRASRGRSPWPCKRRRPGRRGTRRRAPARRRARRERGRARRARHGRRGGGRGRAWPRGRARPARPRRAPRPRP
ncbi:Os06g0114400, partial [Oryza sativa Japonica Group]